MYTHIRTWFVEGEFRLDIWDTGRTRNGKSLLRYALFDYQQPIGKGMIFEGEDFCPSPLHAIDSDRTVGALLGFLSLRPGDTDPEYFQDYTADQLEWANSNRPEELSMYAYTLENPDEDAFV